MIDLRALRHLGLLELDEIPDLGPLGEPRARTDAGEWANARLGADDRALDMAERLDYCTLGHFDPGAENHVRLNRHVAREARVISEPHTFGIDQGRAFVEDFLTAASLPLELEMRELCAA